MVTGGSMLIDFDGTACLHDVAEHLLAEFADGDWRALDAAWERGEIGTRETVSAQAAMLRATDEELVAFALEHCPLDPTFPPFVDRWQRRGVPVTVVSDGFGLYIEPLLRASGLADLPVVTNGWRGSDGTPLVFPNGHPVCVGCGTCKMQSVLDARAPVVFVGEGGSDRYAALYADVVFAKDALVPICEEAGVPYLDWGDFDDVTRGLEDLVGLPGAVAPERCPGWEIP